VLVIAETGTVALTGTGSVVLTGAASDGARLAGAGKLTAGATEIVGGTSSGWQAVAASGSAIITIASSATAGAASITAGAATTVLTAQAAGAAITVAAGGELALAINTTIDLNEKGTITLAKAVSGGAAGGKITFPATASSAVIKTGTTGSGGNSVGIANATIADVTLVSENSGNKLVTITSTGTAGSVGASGATNDVVISKDTDVTT
jgi:hypothetical protein